MTLQEALDYLRALSADHGEAIDVVEAALPLSTPRNLDEAKRRIAELEALRDQHHLECAKMLSELASLKDWQPIETAPKLRHGHPEAPDIDDVVAMCRAAARDERLSTGALYNQAADEIVLLRERLRKAADDAEFYKKLSQSLPEILGGSDA